MPSAANNSKYSLVFIPHKYPAKSSNEQQRFIVKSFVCKLTQNVNPITDHEVVVEKREDDPTIGIHEKSDEIREENDGEENDGEENEGEENEGEVNDGEVNDEKENDEKENDEKENDAELDSDASIYSSDKRFSSVSSLPPHQPSDNSKNSKYLSITSLPSQKTLRMQKGLTEKRSIFRTRKRRSTLASRSKHSRNAV